MSIFDAIHVTGDMVAPMVRGTFPDYRGKKFQVIAAESVTLHDLNWSGGSRCQYRACTITGQPLGNADRFNQMAPWRNPAEGQTLPIVPGACVVQHTLFCGQDLGLRIYVHPCDLTPLLPPVVDLSQLETAIIDATASFKSSYNGKDRYSMARPESWSRTPFHGYSHDTFPSREVWAAAVSGLIAKGFLDKRGALTIKGRNARVRNPR
jgi:hypothetical protein